MTQFGSIDAAANGPLRGAALCLGNFDGVHKGHQALIAAAKAQGRAAALTFDPHPGRVLQPNLAPRLITSLPRKVELLEAHGVELVIVQPFTADYARSAPEAFEAALFDGLGVAAVVVGQDFSYGARRAGTVERLTGAARARGKAALVVPPVTVDGVVVSSSHIREYLLEGRVEPAALLLGRPFDLDGRVVAGAGRGRTLGFPTANVESSNELRPAAGVYAVRVHVDTRWVDGAANLGTKPTFGEGESTLEVHLLDFAGDLYGRSVRVQFLARLRPERRFASVGDLTEQIARDVDAARVVCRRAPT